MPKQAPSAARIAAMLIFSLSCVGIVLFLWVAFGGPTPLKPKPYEATASFPEATTLAEQADVRISGVKVGRVETKTQDGTRTKVVMGIDSQYAPLRTTTRAILRQKTLLGETYVELTPATRSAPVLKDGGTIPNTQIAQTVQLDEIFRAFDPPTRAAFRTWFDQQGRAFTGRGADLNNALGNLTPFVNDATDIVKILNQQKEETTTLVRDTGVVFDALSQRDGQLTDLIRQSNRVFQTTAERNNDLKQTFVAFPTFLQQARLTSNRVTQFAKTTNPLITQLRPAARQLSPTLQDLHGLAPDLRGLFKDLRPLQQVAVAGFPALSRFLDETRPLLTQLDPFLQQLNPIVQYIGPFKKEVATFFANSAAPTQATDRPAGSPGPVHYLRTSNPLNPDNLAVWPHRTNVNRSNPYPEPGAFAQFPLKVFGKYLCSNAPVPPLAPAGGGGPLPSIPPIPGLPSGLPGLPTPVVQELPDDLRNLINQFAYTASGPVAPPCEEQAPLGRLVGQPGLYPHVLPAPAK
jgi:phospholipid/cholesterol/gamma-HCH transport system substrate-binding protein